MAYYRHPQAPAYRFEYPLEAEQYARASAIKYGVNFENIFLAMILDSQPEVRGQWHRTGYQAEFWRWEMIRTYLWTTSKFCGNKTAGAPHLSTLRFVSTTKAYDSPYSIWHSARLKPLLGVHSWGDEINGFDEFNESFQRDFTALIKAKGCGSHSFRIIEDLFLSETTPED
jgi:hypothetical protein